MDYSRVDLNTQIKHMELELKRIFDWITYDYSTFKPTDGAVDERGLRLSKMLNRYSYFKQEHEKLLNALEKRMMDKKNA